MKYDKKDAVLLINKKLNGESFLSYKEIADITGYHPKYILKLKKEILSHEIHIEHGNKQRTPINKMPIDKLKEYTKDYTRYNNNKIIKIDNPKLKNIS